MLGYFSIKQYLIVFILLNCFIRTILCDISGNRGVTIWYQSNTVLKNVVSPNM
jgi:hypothetical protein